VTSIHRAMISDISEIMEFIGKEWTADHVLSKSKELFLWQYGRQGNEELNFVLARNNKELVGILGLTFNSQYCKTKITKDIKWLSMWKVTPEAQTGTGLRLLNLAESMFPTFGMGTVGCTIKALQIYKSLGYLTGELTHFYYPNNNHVFDNSSIYNFRSQELHKSHKQDLDLFVEDVEQNLTFKKLNLHLNKSPEVGQFKPSGYMINRYLNHPFYKYQLKLIIDSNRSELGFIIFRVSQTPKGNVLRVLELVMNEKATDVSSALKKLLVQNNCQYADFYTKIVHEDNTYENGLMQVDDSMNLPNLFEPLLLQKSKKYFAIKLSQETSMQLTRGDCDQDRPNILT